MTASLGRYRILDLYHPEREPVVSQAVISHVVAALERLDPYPTKQPRYVIAKEYKNAKT